MRRDRRLLRVACCGIAVMLAAAAAYAQAPTPLTLNAALERAMIGNPALLAARTRRAIGAAGVAVAGERLNPEGRVEFDRDTPHQAYTVAIPLELGGKRARRIDAAEAAMRTADAEIAQLIAATRNEVRRAYFDRAAAEARLALLDDLQTITARARDAARARFEAGSAPRLEQLQAELALAQQQNETTGARGTLAAARTRFNALLGLPLDTTNTLAPADVLIPITFEAAIARAKAESAELAVIDRRIEEQKTRVALAKAMQTPDVTPEAAITRGFGSDAEFQTGWKAALAVSIPIFTTHKAGVALEESTLAQLTAERSATETRITGAVSAAITVADALRQQYVRYRDEILPQAIQVENMADDAYRLGQTGIAAYLQALQATREVRMRSLQAEADLLAALADLEQAMGAPLQ
ncbi:MAG TPA: TolC family protein [Vicinamibacterales bacterium]|nr:TolC family protein [Vicinamibacterales bacterium]